MAQLTLIWSFRNRLKQLIESVVTADLTCPKDVNFVLVDAASNEETIKSLRELCSNISDRKIRICESAKRTSICEAWNLGIMLSETPCFAIASSDVRFSNWGWHDTIINHLSNGYDYVMIENHALFGLARKTISQVGWFDENFNNGPHFDCDYMIRVSEANCKVIITGNPYYSHSDSEEETRDRLNKDVSDRLPMNTFDNEDYFRRKWYSDWPGWRPQIERGEVTGLAHPPTHHTQVKRQLQEIDPHPIFRQKILV